MATGVRTHPRGGAHNDQPFLPIRPVTIDVIDRYRSRHCVYVTTHIQIAVLALAMTGCSLRSVNLPQDEQDDVAQDEGDEPGDVDEQGDGDGDGDEPGDEDPSDEGPPADMGQSYCSLPVINVPLDPTFGDPSLLPGQQCPVEVDTWVKAYQSQDGYWMVGLCTDGCASCDAMQLHPLGAPGLSLADILPPELADDTDSNAGCYHVEADFSLATQEQTGCVYGSLAIFDSSDPMGLPRFVAIRDDSELGSLASQALDGWRPIKDGAIDCPCADVDPELIECCGFTVQLVVYDLATGDLQGIVQPPSTGNLMINGGAYTFYGQQAQLGFGCPAEPQFSWALRLD
jgi:hypothetical protein